MPQILLRICLFLLEIHQRLDHFLQLAQRNHRNPARNENRRNQVLDRMVANNYLDSGEAENLKKISVKTYLNPTPIRNGCSGSVAPYFCDYVVQELQEV